MQLGLLFDGSDPAMRSVQTSRSIPRAKCDSEKHGCFPEELQGIEITQPDKDYFTRRLVYLMDLPCVPQLKRWKCQRVNFTTNDIKQLISSYPHDKERGRELF